MKRRTKKPPLTQRKRRLTMRWSVVVSLIFVALFGIGLRSAQPDMGVEKAHAQGPRVLHDEGVQNAKDNGKSVQWKDQVVSAPYVRENEANLDALVKAKGRLAAWLQTKYPDLQWSPTPEF